MVTGMRRVTKHSILVLQIILLSAILSFEKETIFLLPTIPASLKPRLVIKDLFKSIKDLKVIPSEEGVPQHKLLVCELKLRLPKISKKIFQSKPRCWKL